DAGLEARWNRNVPDFSANGFVERRPLLEPGLQFAIAASRFQGLGDIGVILVRAAGAVRQQNGFNLFLVQEHSFRAMVGSESASSSCNCARPREIRDLTVPSGISRIRAISR